MRQQQLPKRELLSLLDKMARSRQSMLDRDSSSVDPSSIEVYLFGMGQGADVAVRFGERLRKLRQARGLSQEAFASACGLDRTYISGIERGKRNVSLRNIEVLAKALGMSISELTKAL